MHIPRFDHPVLFLGRLLAVPLCLALLFGVGCSSRHETPTLGADSTFVYAAKDPGGVAATITFCRKVGRKSGKRYGIGRLFTMGPKSKVRACIDLENQFALGDRDLMFHLVWLGPGDKSFYEKRIDYTPSDSTSMIQSAISIPPGRRDPGAYGLKVYLFRELIAEKRFELQADPDAVANAELPG